MWVDDEQVRVAKQRNATTRIGCIQQKKVHA
jgi:hypothetical protein